MFNNEKNSGFIEFLNHKWLLCLRKVKKHFDYSIVLLLLIISLYNILLYNLKVLEISWDGAAHASNGVLLLDMIREVIIRDHNFSISAMIQYIIVYNLEWYPSLGGTIAVYPLFVPFLFMISFLIFGISYSSAYLVVILMGNICIITTYFLGKGLFDRRVGLLAALFLSFSSVFFAFSKTALLDIPATTMFTLSVYSLIHTRKTMLLKQPKLKRQSFLSGLLIGLAFMTKPTCILIFPVILLCYILIYTYKIRERHFSDDFHRLIKILKNSSWIFCGVIPAFLLISFQMSIFVFSGSIRLWTGQFSNTGTNSGISTFLWGIFYITRIKLSIPIILGIICGLAYAVFKRTKKDKLLLSWYFVIFTTFSIASSVAHRYVLLAFPAMFILLSRAIVEISDRLKIFRPKTINLGTIIVIAIIFLFGFIETLQHPYGYYHETDTPKSETPMEEAALFLVEMNGTTMQMTLNPTISASGMTFYILKHDREHQSKYYDTWWATKRGTMTVDEFKEIIKQYNVSYLLLSDPGNAPLYEVLDKYIEFIHANPGEFSLVRIFEGEEYSIYIYKVRQ